MAMKATTGRHSRPDGTRYIQKARCYEIRNGRAKLVGTAKTTMEGIEFLYRGNVPADVRAFWLEQEAKQAARVAARGRA